MSALNAIWTVGARFIAPARGRVGGRDESRPYVFMCLSALGLTALMIATPANAFESMPPIMQTLLKVFPEENGRFVDEPFGSAPEMPDDAKPLFETFRVVVPTPEDIEKNLARLFAASPDLPIKKITRYDQDPGAPGLPGFRGVWCQTEDKDDVGFSIVTINQNRFLIWAKMGYYPAWVYSSILPTVRDQYARDVGQYLAQLDAKNFDVGAPRASGRGLPEWMDVLQPVADPWSTGTPSPSHFVPEIDEIRNWGLSGVKAIVAEDSLMDEILDEAIDTLFVNKDLGLLQRDFQRWERSKNGLTSHIFNFTKDLFLQFHPGRTFRFAVDRYGRVRICTFPGEGDDGIPDALLFPALPVMATGVFNIRIAREWEMTDPPRLNSVVCNFSAYFWARVMWNEPAGCAQEVTDVQLRTLGHFLSIMRSYDVSLDNVIIRKHDLFW